MNSFVALACLFGAAFGEYHGGYLGGQLGGYGGQLGGYQGGYGGQLGGLQGGYGGQLGGYQGGYGGQLGGYQGGYGGQLGGYQGGNGGHHGHDDHYEHAPAHYSFEYSVHDPHTGDTKAQHETREGDVVKGYYALKEDDGTTREVHYTADPHNGFNAEVRRIGHAVHPASVRHAPLYQHH